MSPATVRKIVVIQVVSLIIGLGAILTAIVLQQRERVTARRDSCQLLIGLVEAATPKAKLAAAHYYIDHTPLKDCNRYAHQ